MLVKLTAMWVMGVLFGIVLGVEIERTRNDKKERRGGQAPTKPMPPNRNITRPTPEET